MWGGLGVAFEKVARIKLRRRKEGDLDVVWTEQDNTEAVAKARAVWADENKLAMLQEAFEVRNHRDTVDTVCPIV